MIELWKDIKNYEGIYQVSNLGRIKTLDKYVNCLYEQKRLIKSREIKTFKNNSGYYIVSLYQNNKSKKFLVHRLVAEAFIPNLNNKKEVNHIDGNKENNCVENLEWVTAKGNILHATKNKLRIIDGCNNWQAKMTPDNILFIRNNYKPRDKNFGRKALAKRFGCNVSIISNIVARKTYKNF